MASRREQLLQGVVARLQAIKAAGGPYNYSGKLVSVQRYRIERTVDGNVVNEWGPRPTIIVREGRESCASETLGTWSNSIQIGCHWVADADSSGGEDLNAAIEDMKRALFKDPGATGFDDQFGVQAQVVGMSVDLEDPRTGEPIDGALLTLSIEYQDQIGAPELSG